jgi:hypothetical protein
MTPAENNIKQWRLNPAQFVQEQFQTEPDRWQLSALESFAQQDNVKLRLALKACAGPGKTAVLAWIGWNFLLCYGGVGQHPKGACVSITKDNLMDNLWPEFSKWQQRSPILLEAFTWTGSRIFAKDHPETWFMSARSWPKTANEDEQGRTLSGLHSEYVLYLIDESGDIPLPVLKSAEQGLSNCKFGRIIQAGNPTSMSGMLYAAGTALADKWQTITITGDPDDVNRSPRIDKDWAIEQIKTYGRDDPWVMAYILGKFPPQAINALIGPEEIDAAMRRIITEHDISFAEKRIGVDCARFGDDRTVIARRQGIAAFPAISIRNARSEDIAARVGNVDNDWGGSDMIFIDATGGYGAGPEDALRLAGYRTVPVNFSSPATNPKYFNKRSEMLCEFAEWVKRGGGLPNSPQLKKELSAHTYFFANGKIRVTEKDAIKKLIKCSPDEVDAYALTFAMPDKPRGNADLGRNSKRGKPEMSHGEYNPLDGIEEKPLQSDSKSLYY